MSWLGWPAASAAEVPAGTTSAAPVCLARTRARAAARLGDQGHAHGPIVTQPLGERAPDAAAVLVDQRQHEGGGPAVRAVEVREREPGDGDDDHRREGHEHEPDPVAEEQTEVLAEGSDEAGEHQSGASSRSAWPVSAKKASFRFGRVSANSITSPPPRTAAASTAGTTVASRTATVASCAGDASGAAPVTLAEPAVGERTGGPQSDLRLEAGIGDERGRCARGQQLAVVEEQEAVAEALGLVHLVRAVEHGGAGAREAEHRREHALARLRIDPHRRLVQQDDLGPVQDAGRETQPSAHADRELRHGLVGAVGEADQVERMADRRGRIPRSRRPARGRRSAGSRSPSGRDRAPPAEARARARGGRRPPRRADCAL